MSVKFLILAAAVAALVAGCGDPPQGKAIDLESGSQVVYYCDYKHGNLVYVSGSRDAIAVIKDPSCAR